MIYGQFQYYDYELNTWFRSIDFHKRELHELLIQLNVLLGFPLVSLPDAKAANMLIDQLMAQEQRFDHVRQHFEHQVVRLQHVTRNPDKLGPSVVTFQESCRGKMKTNEARVVKIKYDCFVFLSHFYQPHPVAVLVT